MASGEEGGPGDRQLSRVDQMSPSIPWIQQCVHVLYDDLYDADVNANILPTISAKCLAFEISAHLSAHRHQNHSLCPQSIAGSGASHFSTLR